MEEEKREKLLEEEIEIGIGRRRRRRKQSLSSF